VDASSTVWIIAVVALIVGALIGYLMGRSGGNDSRQLDLIEQLDETQRELADYKEKVTAHFEETANLVSTLTDSYKAVHQHLAKSSVELCSNEQASRTLEAAMQPRLSDSSAEAEPAAADSQNAGQDAAVAAAPLDYAPKKPDEEGTLSEAFGLKEGEKKEAIKDPADYAEGDEPEKTAKTA
jgi:uncharacterized membrane-anchored protein YhcB (DUF1043 family)